MRGCKGRQARVHTYIHGSEIKVRERGGAARGGVHGSVGGQPRGEMSRGWYKLYRSIDLLSEDPPLAARKLMPLLLLLLLSLFLSPTARLILLRGCV